LYQNDGYSLAEMEGFEPPDGVTRQLISSLRSPIRKLTYQIGKPHTLKHNTRKTGLTTLVQKLKSNNLSGMLNLTINIIVNHQSNIMMVI